MLDSRLGRKMWWAAWLLFVATWTAALLHPRPVEIDEEDIPPDAQFYLAKGLHITAYACCAVLTAGVPASVSWRRMLLAFLCLHAGMTELLQSFIPPRNGSGRDVLLNLTGLGLGVLMTRRFWQKS